MKLKATGMRMSVSDLEFHSSMRDTCDEKCGVYEY